MNASHSLSSFDSITYHIFSFRISIPARFANGIRCSTRTRSPVIMVLGRRYRSLDRRNKKMVSNTTAVYTQLCRISPSINHSHQGWETHPTITRQRNCRGNLPSAGGWFKLLDVVTVSAGWTFSLVPWIDNDVRISSCVGCQHTFSPCCNWPC